MNAGAANLRHTLAELEAMATIRPVKVSGGQKVRMGCPFHGSDRQRSLEVSLETGRFACYTCGAWGYLSDPRGRDHRKLGGAQKAWRRAERPRKAAQNVHAPQTHEKGRPVASPPPLGRYMAAAQRHLEDPEAVAYLEVRGISPDLAQAHSLGYFPPGKWPGRKALARWGRVAFPLETPVGELVGVYSRALDPGYPGEKAPPYVRHDVWGRRGIFNPAALAGPELYLCEGAFDALAMVASGFLTAAALVGTKGLRWPDLGHVRELYLCLDADEEGREAARALARDAVLRGLRAYLLGPGDYRGYGEPSEQWEARRRVTLSTYPESGLDVHQPSAQPCPECVAPICPGCLVCVPSLLHHRGDLTASPAAPETAERPWAPLGGPTQTIGV